MQAALALLGTVAGVAAGFLSETVIWFWGAALLFAVVPFTFIAIMPTNRALLDPSLDRSSPATAALLVRWGRLHAVRSVCGLAAFALFSVAR